jgi:LppX_LprAFG lipoprotein
MGPGRRGAVLAALPLAVLSLAACGSDEASVGTGDNAVAAAAEQTLAEGSARFTLAADIAVSAFGRNAEGTFTGDGEFDFTDTQAHYTLDLTDLGGELGLPGNVTGDVLRDGDVVYLNFPLLGILFPNVKDWIKLDLGSGAQLAGFDLGRFAEVVDPSLYLSYLEAATGEADEVGSEDVSGVQTTHYTTEIDLEQARDTAPESQRSTIDALIASGTTTLPADVWIDQDGLVRKLVFEYSGDSGVGVSSVSMELSDFGVEVALDLPSADEVTDVSELQGEISPASTS